MSHDEALEAARGFWRGVTGVECIGSGEWLVETVGGPHILGPREPVCHVECIERWRAE